MIPALEAKAESIRVSRARNLSTPPVAHRRRKHRKLPRHPGPGRTGKEVSANPSPVRTASVADPSARHLAYSGPIPGWKRVLDLCCVIISLPVTLPLMVAIALWIRITSKGQALFRQERVGRNGRRFLLYKFRTMGVRADPRRHRHHFQNLVRYDCPMVKLDLLHDSRLIPGGCLLRAAGLDELPQLFNVLRGEMSLVGPRPCLPDEYRFFSARQRVRFEALPGLTGIWQVNGKNSTTFSQMNAMDALYVRKASVWVDLAVMVRTPIALAGQMYEAFQRHVVSEESEKHGAVPLMHGRRAG